jgi:hypothetical protein
MDIYSWRFAFSRTKSIHVAKKHKPQLCRTIYSQEPMADVVCEELGAWLDTQRLAIDTARVQDEQTLEVVVGEINRVSAVVAEPPSQNVA